MKKNLWMMVGLLISTSLLADDQLQQPATAAPPDTNAPAAAAVPAVEPTPAPAAAPLTETVPAPKPAKHVKKKKAAKPAKLANEVETPVSLAAGPATVSAKATLNVRGQPKVGSEIVSHLKNGDTVTVIEQVNLKKGEPRQWAKIALPADAKVWVFTRLLDTSNMSVKAKKVNLRSGPGENYSVVGTLEAGAPVKQVQVKGDWTQIEAPAGAYAFVAAQFLHQEPAPAEVAAVPAEAVPTNGAPVEVAAADTNVQAVAVEPAAPAEPAVVSRVVSHEGVVRPTVNPNSPTSFQLVSLDTDRVVDFLYTTNNSVEFDLRGYNGRHVIVTGEEAMDERWKSIPVLTIQQLHVVE